MYCLSTYFWLIISHTRLLVSDVITGDSLPRMIRMEEAYSSASTPISSSVQLGFLCFLSVILGLIADDVSNESNQHACVASVVKIFSYLFLKSSSRKLRLNLRVGLRLRSKIRPLVKRSLRTRKFGRKVYVYVYVYDKIYDL